MRDELREIERTPFALSHFSVFLLLNVFFPLQKNPSFVFPYLSLALLFSSLFRPWILSTNQPSTSPLLFPVFPLSAFSPISPLFSSPCYFPQNLLCSFLLTNFWPPLFSSVPLLSPPLPLFLNLSALLSFLFGSLLSLFSGYAFSLFLFSFLLSLFYGSAFSLFSLLVPPPFYFFFSFFFIYF